MHPKQTGEYRSTYIDLYFFLVTISIALLGNIVHSRRQSAGLRRRQPALRSPRHVSLRLEGQGPSLVVTRAAARGIHRRCRCRRRCRRHWHGRRPTERARSCVQPCLTRGRHEWLPESTPILLIEVAGGPLPLARHLLWQHCRGISLKYT